MNKTKYFLDTEFLEGPQRTWFGGQTKPTIDLISIGMVHENGRQFYAVSKEFNIKEAWNRWQPRTDTSGGQGNLNNIEPREYWIRENVLKPIFDEFLQKDMDGAIKMIKMYGYGYKVNKWFNYENFKRLVRKYGKTKADIANGICEFIFGYDNDASGMGALELAMKYEISDKTKEPIFYAYYADFDWVAFCWLFGSMMTLPKGFPMYCVDLKQMLDEATDKKDWYYGRDIWANRPETEGIQEKDRPATLDEKLEKMKRHNDYPAQTNEHHALADARWNAELHQFINTLNSTGTARPCPDNDKP